MICPAGKCECVHFSEEDERVSPTGMLYHYLCNAGVRIERESVVGWKHCAYEPVPPKKDPLEECESELYKAGIKHYTYRKQPYRIPRDEVLSILKKYLHKPGDVDKAWNAYQEVGAREVDEMNLFRILSPFAKFKEALKAGGFIE